MPDLANPPIESPHSLPGGLGETILSLIQAFLKTGYYTSGHPETLRARAGLFEAVQAYLRQDSEISFIIVPTRERPEIYLGGVKDDVVPLSGMMLKSMADLFIPKFAEYFERKNLASFSLKAGITHREFEAFIDLMTEPSVAGDRGTVGRDRLTAELVRLGILQVSVVFNVDLVGQGRKLPWRVEVALSRIKRDLELIPLYQHLDEPRRGEIRRMVIEDIVRPLKLPEILGELFANLDLIGFDLAGFDPDQIEGIMMGVLSPEVLAAVTDELVKRLVELQRIFAQAQDVELLVRMEYLRGTMGRMCRVLLNAGRFDADLFARLVDGKILRPEDLPPELRERLAEGRLRERFLAGPGAFLAEAAGLDNAEETARRLRGVMEAVPELLKGGRLDDLRNLFALARTRQISLDLPGRPELFRRTLELVRNRLRGEREEQVALIDLLTVLGRSGAAVLAELLDGENRFVRRTVLERLPAMGPGVAPLVLAVLPQREGWYYLRNCLIVLTKAAGQAPQTVELLRRSLHHAEPTVRREAVQGLAGWDRHQAEPLLLPLLKDPHPEVRKRVMAVLGQLGCSHGELLATLQKILSDGTAGEATLLDQALRTTAELSLPAALRPPLEDALLTLLQEPIWFGMGVKRSPASPAVRAGALRALAQVGGPRAAKVVRKCQDDPRPLVAAAARDAALRLGLG